MRKLTVNINDNTYSELSAVSVELEHKSISQTVNYLLENAIYTEREKTFAPLMKNFIKEELDNYTNQLDNKLIYISDEIVASIEEDITHLLYNCSKNSLASLVASSWACTTDKEEAVEIQKDALEIAYSATDGQ